MWNVILEALIDTAKIVPILLLVYLLISYLTHHKEDPYKFLTKKSKYYGPLFGALLGTVPQCGFSAVMADLFSKRAITLGTLFSVFLTTSDEALPILIANPSWYKEMLIILGVKFAIGILFGYLVDFILGLIEKSSAKKTFVKNLKQEALEVHGNLNKNVQLEHQHDHACTCTTTPRKEDHEHHNTGHSCDCCTDNIFLDAIIHTLKIVAFILIINVIFGIVIYYVGMDRFINFVSINEYLQPLVTSLIGLIPNCAGSVFLVELFMEGGITLSATIAGLSIGSGVGILVLFKNNKHIKENIFIVISLYVISVIVGLALTPLLG